MRIAQLNNEDFFVTIRPDVFRFSPKTEMYAGFFPVLVDGQIVNAPMNVVDVWYEILSTHWIRKIEGEDDEIVQFTTPVLFDQGIRTIPFQLHLLIESYRDEPTPEKLAMINGAVAQFPFTGSLEGFILDVTSIQ